MNEEIKKRYQLLKEKNKKKVKKLNLEKNLLFNECINSLNEYKILSLEETENLFKRMKNNFLMTNYGYINWKEFNNLKVINKISDIYDEFNEFDEYYILWEQLEIPCIQCKLNTIIDNIDNVLAVSFDTWLLSKDEKEVIEFHHEGKVTYGKIK